MNVFSKLPTSSSSYIIVDCDAIGCAKTRKQKLASILGAGTIYRMTPEKRMKNYRQKQFKEKRVVMILVRTWKSDDRLPQYAFNVGFAGFVDEFLIHAHRNHFNVDFCTSEGVGLDASFCNDYARSLVNDARKNEMLDLIMNALVVAKGIKLNKDNVFADREITDEQLTEIEEEEAITEIIEMNVLPSSSSSYIIVDCDAIGCAKTRKQKLASILGAGTIYRMTPAIRMHVYRDSRRFKEKRVVMILVRTWKSDDRLPQYAFNVGFAGFVDEFLIHAHRNHFNVDFCTTEGAGTSASFCNDYARSLVNDARKNEMLDLIMNALENFEYVDEQIRCQNCERELSGFWNYRNHLKFNCEVIHNETSTPKFQCDDCNATFTNPHHFDLHFERCPSRKPKTPKQRFVCPHCNGGFTFKTNMYRHIRGKCSALGAKRHSKQRNVHKM